MSIKFIFLLCLYILLLALSLRWGAVFLDWTDLLHPSGEKAIILYSIRIPRLLSASFIGAVLGCVGLVFQTLLRNPLAEPYTLGLSGGGSLGAVFALTFSMTPLVLFIPLFSALGCLLATALVLTLAHKRLTFESRSLILFGIMISHFFGALVVTGLSILSPEKLQAALFWLLGEFGSTRDQWIWFLGPFMVFGLLLLQIKSPSLNVLALGESRALSLGFSPRKERLFLIGISTLMTAMAVSIAGLIGFVGLMSPHLARRFLKTSNHKMLIGASGTIGATLLLLADTVGRTISRPTEIPAGSVAALFGAPILIYMMMNQSHVAMD